jgi:putative transcriptional regulator
MRHAPAPLLVFLSIVLLLAGVRGVRADAAHGTPASGLIGEPRGTEPAPGMLLVAARDLHDRLFGQSVILILQHDDSGSRGLVINRLSDWRLPDVVSGFDDTAADQYPLFFGGPMGFHKVVMLIHDTGELPRARRITSDIYYSDSRKLLEDLLVAHTPADELNLYLGYAGWASGQLAGELARGSWHLVKGSPDLVFGAGSDGLWERMINELEPNGILVRTAAPDWRWHVRRVAGASERYRPTDPCPCAPRARSVHTPPTPSLLHARSSVYRGFGQ